MLAVLTIFWTLVQFAKIGLYENQYTNVLILNLNILLRRIRQISSVQDKRRWCSPDMSDITESIRKHFHTIHYQGLPFMNIFITVVYITCLLNGRWTLLPFQIFPVTPSYLITAHLCHYPVWFSAKYLIGNLLPVQITLTLAHTFSK